MSSLGSNRSSSWSSNQKSRSISRSNRGKNRSSRGNDCRVGSARVRAVVAIVVATGVAASFAVVTFVLLGAAIGVIVKVHVIYLHQMILTTPFKGGNPPPDSRRNSKSWTFFVVKFIAMITAYFQDRKQRHT